MSATGRLDGKVAIVTGGSRGIGAAMLRRLVAIASAQGRREVFLHAQFQAEPFYRRLGFVAEGAISGVDYFDYVLPEERIAQTPIDPRRFYRLGW